MRRGISRSARRLQVRPASPRKLSVSSCGWRRTSLCNSATNSNEGIRPKIGINQFYRDRAKQVPVYR